MSTWPGSRGVACIIKLCDSTTLLTNSHFLILPCYTRMHTPYSALYTMLKVQVHHETRLKHRVEAMWAGYKSIYK